MSAEAIVVTSAAGSFPGLVEALRALPVAVEEHPLIAFAPPLDWSPVDEAVRNLARFGAVAVTSPRAASAFVERLARGRGEARPAALPAVWAAGKRTAAVLGGMTATVRMPDGPAASDLGAAATLAHAMLADGVRGPVLFPCGDIRRDELPALLRAEGVPVEAVICYRTVLADEASARVAAERARVLLVASPSVAGLVARAAPPTVRPPMLAVGPTTAAAARAAGWAPAAVAEEPSIEALVSSVRALLTAAEDRSS